MAYTARETITLDASGDATQILSEQITGFVTNILVNKNGQSGNPTVDISEKGGLGRTILDITQTATGDNIYAVREGLVDNQNTSVGLYAHYFIETDLEVVIASGDNAGTVTIQIQYIPIQG